MSGEHIVHAERQIGKLCKLLVFSYWTCSATRLVASQVLHFLANEPLVRRLRKYDFYKEVVLKLKFPNNSIYFSCFINLKKCKNFIALSFPDRPACYIFSMKMNKAAVEAGKQSVGTEGENDASFKEMGILDHIEKIVKISRKRGIDNCLSAKKGK